MTTTPTERVAAACRALARTRGRAVARGANPAAVAVPCHRVVRSDGALSGYRWGIDRKHALLVREGAR